MSFFLKKIERYYFREISEGKVGFSQRKLIPVFLLAGIVSAGTNFTQLNLAVAAPDYIQPTSKTIKSENKSTTKNEPTRKLSYSKSSLPDTIANFVLRHTSDHSSLPISKLKILKAEQRNWPDSCSFDLSLPATGCRQEMVSGWEVTVAYHKLRWVYHIDYKTRIVLNKAASNFNSDTLPAPAAKAILHQVFKRWGIPSKQLRIAQVEPKQWDYGCDIPLSPGIACDPYPVSGWQVTVTSRQQQRWIYLTDAGGSRMKLDAAASKVENKGLKTFTSSTFRATLQYPSHWKLIEGYDTFNTRYSSSDGFFMMSAIQSEGIAFEALCAQEANHKLKPYGSNPRIEKLQIQGQPACFIWPSQDQDKSMMNQAQLIIQAPREIKISGSRYNNFVLVADRKHIRELAETLNFI